MSLVTSKEMLLKAQKNGYAIAAFNVENMEMFKAVVQGAKELKAPVILQTTSSTIAYGGVETYGAIAVACGTGQGVPICMHLDHGNSYEIAMECIDNNYTSVMIDGSALSFQENVAITKKVVDAAHKRGIVVEAELGKIGGKEDDHEAVADVNTNVAQAKEFVQLTGVDSLAIAIGTAHGFYLGTPVLDYKRIQEIRDVISTPLVLHGSSGLKKEEIQECIKRGICKVNFATDLRVAYTDAVKNLLKEKPDTFDPKDFGKVGIPAVKELVKQCMIICGCAGKADL